MNRWYITRILPFFRRWANWKFITLLAVLFLAFDFFLLPLIAAPGGQKLPVLDTKFFYTPQQVWDALARYSPQARHIAILGHLTVDVIYPIIYGLLLSLLLLVVFRAAAPAQADQMSLLPWRAVFADYLENLGLVTLFLIYPSQFSALAWMTAIFTLLKWVQIGLSIIALLVGGLILLAKKMRPRV